MTTQVKKPAQQQATAKIATQSASTANKAARSALSAVETTQRQANNVVKISTEAVRDLLNSGAGEAQKAHEKIYEMSREGAEQFAKSADMATKAMYEMIALSRDNIEAAIECGNITANLAKTLSEEVFESCNKSFSENMELSKEAFSCRTLNDVIELQNRTLKRALDNFFNQSVRMSGMAFEFANEAFEPLNERVIRASEQLGKAFSGE